MAPIVELQKSLSTIPNSNRFPGNWTSEIIFFYFCVGVAVGGHDAEKTTQKMNFTGVEIILWGKKLHRFLFPEFNLNIKYIMTAILMSEQKLQLSAPYVDRHSFVSYFLIHHDRLRGDLRMFSKQRKSKTFPMYKIQWLQNTASS